MQISFQSKTVSKFSKFSNKELHKLFSPLI